MVESLLLDSLQRRMRTMHSLYYQAVDTMELEHVNHFERGACCRSRSRSSTTRTWKTRASW